MLRTSHADWDEQRVLRTDLQLTEVEATFRQLKSELGVRPIHHRKDRRVSAHIFIAVLAYHAVHLLRTRLKAHGIRLSWGSIRERLREWTRVTTTVHGTDGTLITNRQDMRPSAAAWEIARAAGLQPGLHRQRIRTDRRQSRKVWCQVGPEGPQHQTASQASRNRHVPQHIGFTGP